jgi:hypothetical protein
MQPSAYPLQAPFQHPADDGLVLYLPFQEGTGRKTWDFSGRGNHGNLVNGPTWVVGKHGWALDFDGTDDYVVVDGNDYDIDSDTTWEAWIKITWSLASDDSVEIVSKYGNTEFNYQKVFAFDLFGSRLRLYLRHQDGSNDSNPDIISNQMVGDGNWHHVVATYEITTGDANLYIDGSLDISETLDSGEIIIGTENLYVGVGNFYGGFTNYFNGIIDEVRIYNRALSADEIRRHYEQTRL